MKKGRMAWSFWEADPGPAHGTRCLKKVGPFNPAGWVAL